MILKQKTRRTILCLFFFFFITSTIVVAHERIPESNKIPTDIKIFEDQQKFAILDSNKFDAYRILNLSFATVRPENIPLNQIFLPKNTLLNAVTIQEIDTRNITKNETVDFEITDNVYVNNILVIRAGSKGTAVVESVTPPKNFLIDSIFNARAKETYTVDNIKVPLMFELERAGYNEPPLFTAAAISIYTFFIKGGYIKIPAGTHFFVAVSENVNLEKSLQ